MTNEPATIHVDQKTQTIYVSTMSHCVYTIKVGRSGLTVSAFHGEGVDRKPQQIGTANVDRTTLQVNAL